MTPETLTIDPEYLIFFGYILFVVLALAVGRFLRCVDDDAHEITRRRFR